MKKNQAFKDLQHQFRGIVASLRSSGFQEAKSADAFAAKYYSLLKALLLKARSGLSSDQFRPFVSWVTFQEATVLSEIQSLPKGYEQLAGVSDSKPVTLENEIYWITAVLEKHIQAISEFRELSDKICRLVFSNKFASAIEKLDTLDQKWGVSLWSLQLRVALTNESSGLEAQKKVVADARVVFKKGLLGFVAYYCGVRNESQTTAERFTVTAERRISQHQYFSRETKTFLRHHLLGLLPDNHAGMAEILRVSQSHHFFDIYEDLISVLQALCYQPIPEQLYFSIKKFLTYFSTVKDFRLRKLRYALLNENLQSYKLNKNCILADILSDAPKRAIRSFSKTLREDSQPNPWDYIYMGWAASEGRLRQYNGKRIAGRCVRLVAATFAPNYFLDPHDAITKLAHNFGQLPFFRALRSYSDIINNQSASIDFDHRIVGLNSPVFGLEDLNQEDILRIPKDRRVQEGVIATPLDFWATFFGQVNTEEDCHDAVELAYAVGRSLRQRPQSAAEDTPLDVNRVTLGVKGFFRDVIALQDANESFRRGTVLAIIATACSSAVYSPLRHRILDATSDYVWEHFQQCDDPILRAVAIRMVSERRFDTELLTILRFSVRNTFIEHEVNVPSEIDWQKMETPRDAILFFLNYVCTPDVLAMLREIRGSRQVLDEREKICRLLQKLDPENRDYYSSELAEVRDELSFADGRLVLDSSRIYVEIPHLRQWAKTNLSEDYSRFRDLAALDKKSSQPLDELLVEIIRDQRGTRAQFVPESEADVVLYNILSRLKDEFLTNASFGLDFFLSKRIRHQTFIGSIRAPLESKKLITNRPGEGIGYRPNLYWVDQLAKSSGEIRTTLFNAFQNFAESFDGELMNAKDKFFQIRGKERPEGLIFLPLSSYIVELLESIVPSDSSFDIFLEFAIALLWVDLEPALAMTRKFIKEDLKVRLNGEVSKLRNSVRDTLGNSVEFLRFDASAGECSREVQVRLDDCASWFARTNLDFTKKKFGLSEAIKMAQDYALKYLPDFTPKIDPPEVISEAEILASTLVHIHDQVFIALQNAKDHSGLRSPRVKTTAKVDADEQVLTVRIESEIRPNVIRRAREGAQERRRLISEGKSRSQARREGGSGFFKLSVVASQTSRGGLDFGVTQGNMFFLEVRYSLLVEGVR